MQGLRGNFGKTPGKTPAISFFLFLIAVSVLYTTRLLDSTNISGLTLPVKISVAKPTREKVYYPLNCNAYLSTKTCASNYPNTDNRVDDDPDRPSPPTCPDYFRWIHEDLQPWARTGVTRDMVERGRKGAHFRLVILDGRVYVETYRKSYQTRDMFTVWGILQLIRRYPGRIPDLELMFDCDDYPLVSARNTTSPASLFGYSGNDETLDVVFPDWSFWGWVEINVKPWELLLKDLDEGNRRIKWEDRQPFAFWKGNANVAAPRRDLYKCRTSDKYNWSAHIYAQNWREEMKKGFRKSNLANQCDHRYKIYVEGNTWSVSEKYILACDSMTLLVKPRYYDFFTRGLKPREHYWPVNNRDKCRSIKFAVDWGNTHTEEAQVIGKAGSGFTRDELKMENVYDYMFHVLNEYAKLLRFKPTVSINATEICSESMACSSDGRRRQYMVDSMVTSPRDSEPCDLPPPYSPSELHSILRRKSGSVEEVEKLKGEYWKKQTNK